MCNLLLSKLQEKPSAFKREHPAPQKIKLIIFCSVFMVRIANPDPDSTDPGAPLNLGSIRIRINSTPSKAC
jgi:hypothetical protein